MDSSAIVGIMGQSHAESTVAIAIDVEFTLPVAQGVLAGESETHHRSFDRDAVTAGERTTLGSGLLTV